MSFLELFFIALGLSMDAFAVSICKGLATGNTLSQKNNSSNDKKIILKVMLVVGLYFGIFQGLMPLIGYFLGFGFKEKIIAISHFVAFGLLVFLGLRMIFESYNCKEESEIINKPILNFSQMIILAIATSIDALAVGITFAFLDVKIISAVILISIITFINSSLGVKIGIKFGDKFKNKAEIAGGVILILMGSKIFLEHLFS